MGCPLLYHSCCTTSCDTYCACRKRDADQATSPDGAKRPAKAAKKEEAAGSGELRELIGAQDIASAPKRKGAVGRRAEPEPKPPPYQQVQLDSQQPLTPVPRDMCKVVRHLGT